MKKLSIVEKAKAYDEALRIAQELYNDPNSSNVGKGYVCTVFPKLKGNDNERIRKGIESIIKHYRDNGETICPYPFVTIEEALAWLEKQDEKSIIIDVDKMVLKYSQTMDGDFGLPINCQIRAYRQGINDTLRLEKQGDQKPYGQREECLDCQFNYAGECKGSCAMKRCEQKPDDNVEPKFKVGDWVVYCGDTYQITGLNNNTFTLTGCDDSYFFNLVESTHEPSFHLWSIQDAKDGDILVVENIIFIYKRALSSHIVSYCKLINDVFEPTVDARTCCEGNPYVHPATKEQRDLLFSKMREFGYEWDTKEKQLMKVPRKVQATGVLKQLIDEQKSVDVEEPNFFDDFRNSDVEVDSNEDGLIAATIKYKNEQKLAWSEDDENMLRRVFDSLNTYAKNGYSILKSIVEEEINWLKSLKERTKGE